jgi:hypothetical protein
VYRTNVVMVAVTTGILFLLLTCTQFWVWGILRIWSTCALTIYDVVRDCQQFEKHWCRAVVFNRGYTKTP